MKKLLFVQFRTDASREHEQGCVRELLGIHDDRIVFVSAVLESLPDLDDPAIAGVVLGGSGEFFLSEDDGKGTWRDATFAYIDEILMRDIPLLGICFGYQFLAMHQGGHIVRDPALAEVGSFPVVPLPAAADDAIFSNLPEQCMVQLGHKESIVDMPNHLIPLVRSERIDAEVFRIEGKRAWGVLFHLELTKQSMSERLDLFPNYAASPEAVAEIKAAFHDTPEATAMFRRFVDMTFHYT